MVHVLTARLSGGQQQPAGLGRPAGRQAVRRRPVTVLRMMRFAAAVHRCGSLLWLAGALLLLAPSVLGTQLPPQTNLTNHHLKLLSFYDMDFALQRDFLTLAIEENAGANQFYAAGIPSLAPLDKVYPAIYVRQHASVGGSVLAHKWEQSLEAWVEHLAPALRNGTLRGIFVGDEICCHVTSCWHSVLYPITAKLRLLLSGFGKDMIVYTNECGSSIAGGGSAHGHPIGPPLDAIAPGLTHISIDIYAGYEPATPRSLNGTREAVLTRTFVERYVYPKMQPGQLLMLVPGTFACSNLSFVSLAQSDTSVSTKLEAYLSWALEDHRIAGFCPWHFHNKSSSQAEPGDPCDMRLGAVALPKTMAVLRRIGALMKANIGLKSDDLQPGCRQRELQPFASTSIWNVPVGDGAEFVPAGIFATLPHIEGCARRLATPATAQPLCRAAGGVTNRSVCETHGCCTDGAGRCVLPAGGPPLQFHIDLDWFITTTPADPLTVWHNQGVFGCATIAVDGCAKVDCKITGRLAPEQIPFPHNLTTTSDGGRLPPGQLNNNAVGVLMPDRRRLYQFEPLYRCAPGSPILAVYNGTSPCKYTSNLHHS